MKILKWIFLPLLAALTLWSGMLAADYIRVVKCCEKPLFCMASGEVKKTGSGSYRGLGYEFIVREASQPEEGGTKGISYAEFYLLGKRLRVMYRGVAE